MGVHGERKLPMLAMTVEYTCSLTVTNVIANCNLSITEIFH